VAAPVLEVDGLTTTFATDRGPFRVIEDIGFAVRPGEVFALLGESGCGKTVTALSIMRLAGPTAAIEGRVRLDGGELLTLTEREMRDVRGGRISIVLQNPFTALDPALRIGDQIAEAIRAHGAVTQPGGMARRSLLRREDRRGEVWAQVVALLRRVGIPEPDSAAECWPHEFSGGMCQRAVIAVAVACSPQLLIADEPTTALDVTVQREIVSLLDEIRNESKVGILLVSHDFALVAEFADRAAVLYAGQVVERADTERLLGMPLHPYTKALLECVPALDEDRSVQPIPGSVPSRYDAIQGCRFHPRCSLAEPKCGSEAPVLREIEKGHWVRCHLV
jgi:oligopeptide/dipeptide ABC transporter ATP-binding protein